MQNSKEQKPLPERGFGLGWFFSAFSLTDGLYCLTALSESVFSSWRAGCMQVKICMLEGINKLNWLK